MKRLLALIALMFIAAPPALAQDIAVTFDGEPFTRRFEGKPPNGDKLLEFVRESDSFEKWEKLVAFRYQQLPRVDNDPAKVAVSMAQIVKASNPQAQSRVLLDKEKSEAIIDFLTWPPDGKFMEFNVFRYARSADGKAVVSLQLAYRFTDTSSGGVEQFKKVRASWINQAVAFDMAVVHAAMSE